MILVDEAVPLFSEVSDKDLDLSLDPDLDRDLHVTIEEETLILESLVSLSQSFLKSEAFDPDSQKCMHEKARCHINLLSTIVIQMSYQPLSHHRNRFAQWPQK